MRLSSLQRLAALALSAGSLLLALYAIAFPSLLPMDRAAVDFTLLVLSPHWLWLAGVAFAGVLLMIAGFAGVYSRLYATAGWTGLIGFVSLELAYLLQACKVTWEICLYPVIAAHPTGISLLRDGIIKQSELVGFFRLGATATILLGTLLFCFTLIRSREFPRIGGIVLLVGAFLYGLHFNTPSAIAGILIHSLGCLILALRLFRPVDTTAAA
jgi:hypothetical protein